MDKPDAFPVLTTSMIDGPFAPGEDPLEKLKSLEEWAAAHNSAWRRENSAEQPALEPGDA